MHGEVLTDEEEVNKLQRAGMMPTRTWAAQCSGDVSHGEVKNEEAYGGCCGQEEYDLPLFVLETHGLEVEEELSTMATQYWAEGVWIGKWCREHKEAWI